MSNKSLSIGLALGGGAVLGAVHIGALKAFEELDIKIKCISGTSIGAFVAALYAFGKSADELEDAVAKLTWSDVSSISVNKMGLLSNKKLGQLIKENIGDKTLSEAKIPLAIIATNIISGEKVILTECKVVDAVLASTCIPGIYTPIEIDDNLLVDGGITENIPLSPLKKYKCDKLVSVDLTNLKNLQPSNIFDVLMNSFNIALSNSAKLQQEDADIKIAPDLSKYNLIDTKQIPDLIQAGYKITKETLESHF